MKTTDLLKTNALVTDFLDASGVSRELILACSSAFHLTDAAAERRQETRCTIPWSRRRQTRKIIPCALLRPTDQEKKNTGLGKSHNIPRARRYLVGTGCQMANRKYSGVVQAEAYFASDCNAIVGTRRIASQSFDINEDGLATQSNFTLTK